MKYRMIVFLGVMLFLGAGCTVDCPVQTPWGSCVNTQGADVALLDGWVLTSQKIIAATGAEITHPFEGRMTTFAGGTGFNAYTEQWSPEFLNTDVTVPGVGVIQSRCQAEGAAQGSWAAVSTTDALGNAIMELWVVPSGEGASVACTAGGSTVNSQAVTSPLGTGVTESGPNGPFVRYQYQLLDDQNTLVISHTLPSSVTGQAADITNMYTFTRQ